MLKVLSPVIRSPVANRIDATDRTTSWKAAPNALTLFHGDRIALNGRRQAGVHDEPASPPSRPHHRRTRDRDPRRGDRLRHGRGTDRPTRRPHPARRPAWAAAWSGDDAARFGALFTEDGIYPDSAAGRGELVTGNLGASLLLSWRPSTTACGIAVASFGRRTISMSAPGRSRGARGGDVVEKMGGELGRGILL